MEVEDALRERLEQPGVKPAHEPCEQDRVDPARDQRLDPRALVFDSGAEASDREHELRYLESARALERSCSRRVAHEQIDGTREAGRARGVDERLEVAAGTRGENGERNRGTREHTAI